jgi:phosphoribosylanthranilate isomerase
MNLWIKICGNTTLADAKLAANAGADAVGFVFAPSPRRVTARQVAAIVAQLPNDLEKIGVFVDASLDEITVAVQSSGLTGVQLHSDAGPDLPAQLRARFGPALRILRVVHFSPDAPQQADSLAADIHIDGVLIDSRTATAVGGTGIAYDWASASQTLFQNTRERKLIAAGGLKPENVDQAIATLHPWGVDVSSGVEAEPGRKDPAKINAFIANARAASR